MMKKLKSSRKLYIVLAMAVFVLASFFVISLLNDSYARSIDKQIPALKQIDIIDNTQSLISTDMVVVDHFIPGIKIDMRYAGDNNVYGQKIYDDATAYLRKGTVDKLKAVQEELEAQGYALKIWDAYRPPRAQFKLWEMCPDGRYVANPYKGYSNHSRGCTVDVTLVDLNGHEVEMPSGFDDFSSRADRNYQEVSKNAAANAMLLEETMKKHGFTTIASEWWHFDDNDKNSYEVVQVTPVSKPENLPEKSLVFEDWRAGNYQPLWLANDKNSRQLIDKAMYQGLIRGYDRNGKHYLKLSRYMTRAEYAVLLARVLNLNPNKTKNGEWYLPYTSALIDAGVVSEDDWSSTDWNQYIKRMEMAQWTGKSLLINKYQSGTQEIEGINSPEIRAAILSGLINGDANGNYNWQNSAERVHGTIVLMKLQQVLNLPSPVSDGDNLIYGESALRTITITAIGDCTLGTDPEFPYVGRFDATLKAVNNNYGYFFNNVRTVLENDDLTIANLETTFTIATKKANKGKPDEAYFFKGDPSYTKILKQGSIEAVNLANNHSYDYLAQGYQDTMSNLNQAGILFFGYDKKAVANVNGIKIGMLGYNVLGRLEEGINISGLQKQIAGDIEQMERDCQLVIVSIHWGIEASKAVTKQQSALGHFVIDSGADLVLGHHPHVIQKVEKYNGKYIVYSLGNFSFGGNHNPHDKDTFIFQQSFVFNQDDICVNTSDVKIIPCSISSVSNRNNFCPTPVYGEAAQRILKRVGLPTN